MSGPNKSPDLAGIFRSELPADIALEMLAQLVHRIPSGVAVYDATDDEFRLVYANEAAEPFMESSPGSGIGRPLADVFPSASVNGTLELFKQVRETGRSMHFRETTLQSPEGHRSRSWNWDVYPLTGSDGVVAKILGVGQEVTDLVRARERLRTAADTSLHALLEVSRHAEAGGSIEQFFGRMSATVAELVHAGKVIFLMYDPEHRVLNLQPEGFGVGPMDVAGMLDVPCDAEKGDLAAQIMFEDRVLLGALDPGDPELARHPPLLTALDARSRLAIAWRAGDERLGAMGAYNSTRPDGFTEEDVLIMKTAAQASGLVWQRRRAELVVERRAAEMEGLERSKSRFLNLASHELKGPITVLRGYIAMLGDGVFPARELPELASLLEGRVAQMDFLVTQMVEAARLEDSRLDLRHELVDIRESVRDAVAAVTLTRRPHRAVETFLPTEPVWVVGDGPRIETICLNLLDNALKYSPGDAHVTCRVSGGEHPDVSVSDDGVGIPPDLIGELFTRFGRIENPLTRSVPGTGLGLYISREVARQHGGDITVESTPGVGSTFTLRFPKAAASAS